MEKSFTIMLLEDEGYKPVAMVKVEGHEYLPLDIQRKIILFANYAEGPWLQAPPDYGVKVTPFVSQCRPLGNGDIIIGEDNYAWVLIPNLFSYIHDWKYFLAKMEDSIEDGITTYSKMKEEYSHV